MSLSLYRRAREIGAREDGAREIGAREIGAREDGAREIGAPEDGVPEIGARKDGAREIGAHEDGVPEIGTPEDGAHEDGVPEIGVPEIGAREISAREDSVPEIGAHEIGAREDGVPEIGAREDGAREIGAPEIGVPEIGVPEDSNPEDSAPEIGVPEIGAREIGAPEDGAVKEPACRDRLSYSIGNRFRFTFPKDTAVYMLDDHFALASRRSACSENINTRRACQAQNDGRQIFFGATHQGPTCTAHGGRMPAYFHVRGLHVPQRSTRMFQGDLNLLPFTLQPRQAKNVGREKKNWRLAPGARRESHSARRLEVLDARAPRGRRNALGEYIESFIGEEKAKIAELRLFLSKSHPFAKIALQIQYAEDIPVSQYIYDLP